MRGRTRDFLRHFNIGPWLIGFNVLGDAIDIVMDDCRLNKIGECYDILVQKYGRSRRKIDDDIRRTISLAWRERGDVMERVMQEPLDKPPSPKRFICVSADYLNELAKKEMK